MASSQDPRSKLSNTGSDFVSTLHHDVYDLISPMNPINAVSNFSVLIAGCSRSIGRATALAFVTAGASRIAISARSDLSSLVQEIRSHAEAAQKPAPQILALELDIRSEKSVVAAAERIHSEWGHLDLVINNAGIMLEFHPITSNALSTQEWWSMYETNMLGLVRTFIALTSAGAHFTSPGGSAYQSSKLATIRFCEFIAVENESIVAFSVHPGGIESDTSRNLPENLKKFIQDTVELPAGTLLWLGRERREWLNGRYISSQWDMGELEGKKGEIARGELLRIRMAVE